MKLSEAEGRLVDVARLALEVELGLVAGDDIAQAIEAHVAGRGHFVGRKRIVQLIGKQGLAAAAQHHVAVGLQVKALGTLNAVGFDKYRQIVLRPRSYRRQQLLLQSQLQAQSGVRPVRLGVLRARGYRRYHQDRERQHGTAAGLHRGLLV
jgi:hypothetical protein